MNSVFFRIVVISTLLVGGVVEASGAPARAMSTSIPIRVDGAGNVGRWDPCAKLQWKISNMGNKLFERRVLSAVHELNGVTGLNFVFTGAASHDEMIKAPTNTLVVALVPRFANPMVGGNTRVNFVDGIDQSIVIAGANVQVSSRVTKGSWRRLLTPVLLHELGHAVGLAHVNDAQNIMFPRAISEKRYSPQEIANFAAFGVSAGCHPSML